MRKLPVAILLFGFLVVLVTAGCKATTENNFKITGKVHSFEFVACCNASTLQLELDSGDIVKFYMSDKKKWKLIEKGNKIEIDFSKNHIAYDYKYAKE